MVVVVWGGILTPCSGQNDGSQHHIDTRVSARLSVSVSFRFECGCRFIMDAT